MEKQQMESQKMALLKRTEKELNQLMSITAQGGKLISGNTTLEKIYQVKEAGTNGLLCKNGFEQQAVSLMSVAITELSSMADTNMTSESAIDTAIMIAYEYPHHRPQELIVVLKNGIGGKYGKTYGKITAMEVMRWVKEYDETERAEFFERPKHKETGWQEMDADLLKAVIKTPDSPKVEQKVEQSDNNKWVQQVMRDFDKGAKQIGGMMFIKMDDDIQMSLDEYLQYRVKKDFPLVK